GRRLVRLHGQRLRHWQYLCAAGRRAGADLWRRQPGQLRAWLGLCGRRLCRLGGDHLPGDPAAGDAALRGGGLGAGGGGDRADRAAAAAWQLAHRAAAGDHRHRAGARPGGAAALHAGPAGRADAGAGVAHRHRRRHRRRARPADRRHRADLGRGALRLPALHQARLGGAGDGTGFGRGAADGRRRQPREHGGLRHRLGAERRQRRAGRHVLQPDQHGDELRGDAEGHRRAHHRRAWQCPRGDRRLAHPRADRELRHRALRHLLPQPLRLRAADRHAGLAAERALRRAALAAAGADDGHLHRPVAAGGGAALGSGRGDRPGGAAAPCRAALCAADRRQFADVRDAGAEPDAGGGHRGAGLAGPCGAAGDRRLRLRPAGDGCGLAGGALHPDGGAGDSRARHAAGLPGLPADRALRLHRNARHRGDRRARHPQLDRADPRRDRAWRHPAARGLRPRPRLGGGHLLALPRRAGAAGAAAIASAALASRADLAGDPRRPGGGALLRRQRRPLQGAGLRLRRLRGGDQRRHHGACLFLHQPRDLRRQHLHPGADHGDPRRARERPRRGTGGDAADRAAGGLPLPRRVPDPHLRHRAAAADPLPPAGPDGDGM
ncbi:MAG: ABC transporter, permease protein 1 (cluster 4, leucine/isoleucine/valine/benzoate) / ABC transporter, permease protein 2 (cluster 4, leucine/isoleucine/valine/benzoate), partial [uncultured Craurococcus sp.]